MTPVVISAVLLLLLLFPPPPPSATALSGSASTFSISYGSSITICSIIAQQPNQYIQCWKNGQLLPQIYSPLTSFNSIAGGFNIFCAIRSNLPTLLCWDTVNFTPRRLYFNYSSIPLTAVTIGDTQICALTNTTGACWRGNSYKSSTNFIMISSGLGFSCGVLQNSNNVVCWGSSRVYDSIALEIQSGFANVSMLSIFAGGKHACGLNVTGFVVCKGDNQNGQLNVPSNRDFEYSSLAVGANHSCGIRRLNNTVICWGDGFELENERLSGKFISNVSFESIVAGLDFTCGLVSSNFSIVCWGPGWPESLYPAGVSLPLPETLPGPCVEGNCKCGIYPESQRLCFGNGKICRQCDFEIGLTPPPPPNRTLDHSPSPRSSSSTSRGLKRGLFVFAIVGSVGGLAGICTVIYCLWTGVCFGKKKVHNSVQPTISTGNYPQQSNSSPPSRSSTLRRQGSRLVRRQRSGPSSKHAERAEEFIFHDLALATDNFSKDNKIGAGSFGVVYKGKLPDGREVAIKRSENGPKNKKFQEKESAFESELAFLSRLHHKHLVRLVGFCEENEERLLVYEYMKNGALFDHLHSVDNVDKPSSVVNSWKMRIKISLDAARGIDYLHNYAVPPIIHRDIKSSNILLDANWTARVSDFGLSLMSSTDSDRDFIPTMKAAGTVGYIDPEAYSLNVLTAKSDVYGLGVVLLELLTGKRAIFKTDDGDDENGGEEEPISVVEYAVPQIMAGELVKILDRRVGPPDLNEAEAVELMAYTALHCVNLEGKDRPTMADIVANLERAFVLCEDTLSSISSDPISIGSE